MVEGIGLSPDQDCRSTYMPILRSIYGDPNVNFNDFFICRYDNTPRVGQKRDSPDRCPQTGLHIYAIILWISPLNVACSHMHKLRCC